MDVDICMHILQAFFGDIINVLMKLISDKYMLNISVLFIISQPNKIIEFSWPD